MLRLAYRPSNNERIVLVEADTALTSVDGFANITVVLLQESVTDFLFGW